MEVNVENYIQTQYKPQWYIACYGGICIIGVILTLGSCISVGEGERERGREGGREGGRKGGREGGREGEERERERERERML